jgi:polar amino acid transport system substrate-binding protein
MAPVSTIEPGVLSIASAFPDPPFEVEQDGVDTGLDAELMELVCGRLGLRRNPVRYGGDDFDGIFDGLRSRTYDAVISGTTITTEREKVALFCDPYLESGQSLAVNVARTPHVTSVDDLTGLVIGIQIGNTSDVVARDLELHGKIADIRYYPYGGIGDALDDLSAGRIGGFIKLLPVLTWLTSTRPGLRVVQEIPIHERIGIAVALDNAPLRDAVNQVLADLRRSGDLQRLTDRWLRQSVRNA